MAKATEKLELKKFDWRPAICKKGGKKIIQKYFSDFTAEQLQRFAALESLYKEWNSKINVISRKDIDGLYETRIAFTWQLRQFFHFNRAWR